jgi:hypothetical protein
MGLRQLELVREGKVNLLLDLLSARQRAMLHLQKIERELDPFRTQDPESREWRTAADRERCAGLLAQCESLLAEIIAQEKQSEREMVRRRDEVAGRLQCVHTGREVHGAYFSAPGPEGTRLDVVSDT